MPWIVEDALEIGAVYTLPKYRGKGLYSFSLETLIKNDDRTYFMIVESENNPSIKGIEKAGFKFKIILKILKIKYIQIMNKREIPFFNYPCYSNKGKRNT